MLKDTRGVLCHGSYPIVLFMRLVRGEIRPESGGEMLVVTRLFTTRLSVRSACPYAYSFTRQRVVGVVGDVDVDCAGEEMCKQARV